MKDFPWRHEIRTCQYKGCGQQFTPKHSLQKFCCYQHKRWDEEDKRIAQNAEKFLKKEKKKCIICKNLFIPKVSFQLCCCATCSKKRKNQTNLMLDYKNIEKRRRQQRESRIRNQKSKKVKTYFEGDCIFHLGR